MSLINEVLNELEKRGEHVSLPETSVRAVPPRTPIRWGRYVAAACAAGLAAWLVAEWPPAAVVETAAPDPALRDAAGAQVPGLPAASSVAAAEVSDVASAVLAPPASKLSLELAVIPLPAARPVEKSVEQERRAPRRPQASPQVRPERPRAAAASRVLAGAPDQGLPLKKISPQQQVENEFRSAALAAQEGRLDDALAGYKGVLRLDPLHHEARRGLAGVLLGLKRNDEAEKVLQEGLKLDSRETSLAMLLARLQVERDAVPLALETLQRTLPYADGQADYHAFAAALLQRQERHAEAITHFQVALQRSPGNGIWWMGMGISMQALRRNDEARIAYQRALASEGLSAQLQAFVQKKLKEL